MNDEPFSHRAGAHVPEDVRRNARRLVAGGSESEGVVVADHFHEYQNLEWLELREGTLKIRAKAFLQCRQLSRVDSPSSLRWIGAGAFYGCLSLSEMNLPEGLLWIGLSAFEGHSFRQITIPSSVREIGHDAFAVGRVLREVTFAGGGVLVYRNAFCECPQLRNIATPSVVIVVEDGEYGNGRAEVVTGGTIALDRHGQEPTRLILSSPYLASMQPEDDDTRVSYVTRVKDAINRIAGDRPPGDLDLEWGDRDDFIRVREGAGRIRSRFLGLLSAHRRAVASILKRAPVWESGGGGVEPGVVEIILSFLGDVEA